METNNTSLELLVNMASSYCKRQWCTLSEEQQRSAVNEQLKELCWNGMLPEMFPELLKDNTRLMVLWEMEEAGNALHLKLSEYNDDSDYFMLHPYTLEENFQLN